MPIGFTIDYGIATCALFEITQHLNIIFGWLQRGNQETPEQMAHICSQFLSEEEWRIGSGIKWSRED